MLRFCEAGVIPSLASDLHSGSLGTVSYPVTVPFGILHRMYDIVASQRVASLACVTPLRHCSHTCTIQLAMPRDTQ